MIIIPTNGSSYSVKLLRRKAFISLQYITPSDTELKYLPRHCLQTMLAVNLDNHRMRRLDTIYAIKMSLDGKILKSPSNLSKDIEKTRRRLKRYLNL